ncbi:exodeoxyribonuclease V subunit gamma [Raineyella sp. LH-20]|uniref:exodeoxyribonuclease V subunit gamma n=1 Tax=Raineyella sp. LH-20 TaxID=3081204 RepID=UPI002955344F|nr:exodeoxyribonuclease V subunit gamma [Raineyella sp. LH-20]WOP20257.1 exodeoxyribonuclease V subunit gamma [Raineyella sp. LH-20]
MTHSSPTGRPTLHLGAAAEVLADALSGALATPPAGVFDELLITCEGPGTQRWLAHRLTRTLGISAGIAMPPLGAWLRETTARAAGVDPDTDPWRPGRLGWQVAALLADTDRWRDTTLGSWQQAQRADGGTVWLARHVAEVLLDYARRRPALLTAWAAGQDAGVPDDLAWQPPLWRALLARPQTAAVPDPVSRIALAEETLAAGPLPGVPATIDCWAPGALSAPEVRLLTALSGAHQVRIWLPGASTGDTRHPLAAVLDHESAATVTALLDAGAGVVEHGADRHRTPQAGGTEAAGRTVLDRLHHDLAAGEVGPPAPPASDDTSISLHSCHGPDRQAEVLRDVVCGLLADDPTLEPRDVLIACADPTLLPVLEAAFATTDPERPGGGHPARAIPVRFADPDRREHNDLLNRLVEALAMGRGRAGATELEAFLAADPVARHFGLEEDDVARAHDLIAAAGVRWGMNAAHRDRFGLAGVGANTWLSGLNRMLVGIAMTEDGSYAVRSGLPLDDVGSSDIDVVGAVAELMARLIRLARTAAEPHTAAEWATICRDAIDRLMTPAPDRAWQLDHAWRILAEVADAAPADAPTLVLEDLLDLIDDAVRGRVPRSAFRSGAMTVCSLTPARHVPYRVVCLAGLDDGRLPRPERADGDNLVDLAPEPTVPGPRHHDRQLFLDLVRAARQHLVLTWTGADPRTGETRPPAVVVSDLLDALRPMLALSDDARIEEVLVARHPLQPYAPTSFGDPAAAPFRASAVSGFDPAAAAGARALTALPPVRDRTTAEPLAHRLQIPAWEWDDAVVPLADVVDVLLHPARAFLRRRAGFTRWSDEEEPADTMPLELDGLGVWACGSRVLEATLRGDGLDDALRAEQLRGTLPPGAAGAAVLDRIRGTVDRILRESAAVRAEAPQTRHVRVPLAEGRVLSADVTTRGATVVSVAYGRIGPRHRLRAWFDLLALAAAGAVDRPRAQLIGRNDLLDLAAPDSRTARFLLDRWVQVATVGLTTPLPLPLRTGAALQSSVRPGTGGSDLWGHRALLQAWDQERDANWELLWGRDLQALVRAPRPAQLPAIGDEPDWIADLARGLWSPLDEAEQRR